jgi:hypothetical protein
MGIIYIFGFFERVDELYVFIGKILFGGGCFVVFENAFHINNSF